MDPKVLIGVATGEYARRADFYDYFNLLEKPANSLVLMCHDRSPAAARNTIFEQAIEHGCSHVLIIDDDMAYPADSLMKLLEHDVDVVSGLYLSRAYPHQPLIFDRIDEQGRAFYTHLDGEFAKLYRIEAAGFGFCLFKIEVLKKMEKPWVRLGEIDNTQWCDDIGFFFRAKNYGIKVYCDTTVLCGHIGTVIITPQFDGKTNSWFTGYNTNGKSMISTPQIPPGVEYAAPIEEKAL